MRIKLLVIFALAMTFSVKSYAQNNQIVPTSQQPSVSIDNISAELTKVSNSLQIFNQNFKAFLDKLPQGVQFSPKQQNLLLSFEILNRAEQRLEILQKFQIELTEKQSDLKNRQTQIEQSITPEGIDRDAAFLGSTQAPEIKENRRKTLEAERISLRQLMTQVSQNLADTNNEVREAADFVKRLRAKILPQIEREVSDSQ